VLNTVMILWTPYNAVMFSLVEDLSQGFVNPGRLVRCRLLYTYVGSNLAGTYNFVVSSSFLRIIF